jgi:hypothetical protein
MWNRVAVVPAVIGFAAMMAVRSELSSVAARTAMGAVAGGLVGVVWVCVAKLRAARERREPS